MSTLRLQAERKSLRARLALTTPAMLVLLVFLVLPLGIMFAVSVQAPGDYGGVKWGQHTLEAYINFLWERDLDDSLVFNTDYLGIFQRSFWLSILTTAGCLLIGFPPRCTWRCRTNAGATCCCSWLRCRSGPTCWCAFTPGSCCCATAG